MGPNGFCGRYIVHSLTKLQRLDKASISRGAPLLKTGNFKVILKIPGGHIAMFSTRALKFRGCTGPCGPPLIQALSDMFNL